MKIKLSNYVVLDCETGGLDRKNQEHARMVPITEVAAIGVSADNFQEFDRFISKISGQYVGEDYVGYDPSLVYQVEALKFTGVTVAQLERDGKTVKEVIDGLIHIFEKTKTGSHLHKPVLVGHNVVYDIPFIQHLFDWGKSDLSKYVSGWKDHKGTFHPSFMDTMLISRNKWVEEGMKHSLGALCERLGVDLFDAHGALADTVATLECFKKLTMSSRNGSVEGGGKNTAVKTRTTFQM